MCIAHGTCTEVFAVKKHLVIVTPMSDGQLADLPAGGGVWRLSQLWHIRVFNELKGALLAVTLAVPSQSAGVSGPCVCGAGALTVLCSTLVLINKIFQYRGPSLEGCLPEQIPL